MSLTAAVAAEIASDALICGALSASEVLSLGNRTSTSPTQNTKRSRKNILLLRRPPLFRRFPKTTTNSDKSQVFALELNQEEFTKKSTDLIRRKFSIDELQRAISGPVHHFETISVYRRKPAVHHLR
jgi:hypothetical protein